jgi:hypothetical protein
MSMENGKKRKQKRRKKEEHVHSSISGELAAPVRPRTEE